MVKTVLAALVAALLLSGCGSGAPSLGASAPDFELQQLDLPRGKVTLADYKGKVVLIDFWATWCGPCLETMPALDTLYKEFKGGFEVIGVTSEEREEVSDFLKRSPVSYPIMLDPDDKAGNAFRVESIPQLYLIDKNGILVFEHVGAPVDMEELRGKIARAIG